MAAGWPDKRFVDRIGTALPIVQAPMAGAGDHVLAVAAAAGGALGSIPCGMLTPDQAAAEVSAVRAASTAPINLNFFCHTLPPEPDEAAWRALLQPFYTEFGLDGPGAPPPLRRPFDTAMAGLVETLWPEVVSFHFGLPDRALLDRVRATGAAIVGNATTIDEARWLDSRGVDFIIAQGSEAGGHAGHFLGGDCAEAMGTFALLPQVVDAVSVPVIAAGGIADARGIAAAFLLGAAAVQIGTAYLRTPESRIFPKHREMLGSAAAEHSVVTNVFSGGLARGLRNRLVDAIGPIGRDVPPYPYASNMLGALRRAAEAAGDIGFSPAWAGQAARLGHDEPAEVLTKRLGREAMALLGDRQ